MDEPKLRNYFGFIKENEKSVPVFLVGQLETPCPTGMKYGFILHRELPSLLWVLGMTERHLIYYLVHTKEVLHQLLLWYFQVGSLLWNERTHQVAVPSTQEWQPLFFFLAEWAPSLTSCQVKWHTSLSSALSSPYLAGSYSLSSCSFFALSLFFFSFCSVLLGSPAPAAEAGQCLAAKSSLPLLDWRNKAEGLSKRLMDPDQWFVWAGGERDQPMSQSWITECCWFECGIHKLKAASHFAQGLNSLFLLGWIQVSVKCRMKPVKRLWYQVSPPQSSK